MESMIQALDIYVQCLASMASIPHELFALLSVQKDCGTGRFRVVAKALSEKGQDITEIRMTCLESCTSAQHWRFI